MFQNPQGLISKWSFLIMILTQYFHFFIIKFDHLASNLDHEENNHGVLNFKISRGHSIQGGHAYWNRVSTHLLSSRQSSNCISWSTPSALQMHKLVQIHLDNYLLIHHSTQLNSKMELWTSSSSSYSNQDINLFIHFIGPRADRWCFAATVALTRGLTTWRGIVEAFTMRKLQL